jgi:hypothetical protein
MCPLNWTINVNENINYPCIKVQTSKDFMKS